MPASVFGYNWCNGVYVKERYGTKIDKIGNFKKNCGIFDEKWIYLNSVYQDASNEEGGRELGTKMPSSCGLLGTHVVLYIHVVYNSILYIQNIAILFVSFRLTFARIFHGSRSLIMHVTLTLTSDHGTYCASEASDVM